MNQSSRKHPMVARTRGHLPEAGRFAGDPLHPHGERSHPTGAVLRRAGFMAAAIATLGVAAGLPAQGQDGSAPGEQSHVFFLGLDVSVLQPEGYLPVEGYQRGSVSVSADGEKRMVKVRRLEDVESRIQPKVSSGSVTLSSVGGYRTYTPTNDPALKAIRTKSRMVADQMSMESSLNESLRSEAVASASIGNLLNATDMSIRQAAGQAQAARAQESMESARMLDGSASFDPLSDAGSAEGADSDAYAVTCLISSEEPVEGGFAVLVTNILYPDATEPVRAVSFGTLPDLSNVSRRVKLVQQWLPVGYQVESFAVHAYRSDGTELATNMSGKRAELSRDEAFSFLRFHYLASNKLENLPARPVLELLPRDLGLYVPQNQRNRTVRLEIDEEGVVSSVQLEQAGAGGSDSFLEEALYRLYFYPALAYGEPVDSSVTLSLADLVR